MRFITFVTLCLLSSTPVHADSTTLSVASGSYAPFSGSELPDDGIVNATVRRIAHAAGYGVEFNYMPWARAIEEARSGTYDATSYWFYEAGREADFIHVGPLNEERVVFYVGASSDINEWEQLEDLSGLRIGVVTGYTYTREFWDLGEAGVLTLSQAQSDEANFRKLLAGRLDVLVITSDVGSHILDKSFSAQDRASLRVLEKPLDTTSGYLLISREGPDAEAVASALQSVIDTEQSQLSQ